MQDVQGIKVTVQLFDTATDAQVWGDVYRSAFEPAQLIAFQDEVAHVIAVIVAGEQGIIARALSGESRNLAPKDLKTYEAILRYYEYDLTFSSESFLRALEALEHAVTIEPECGQAWTMLGRLCANIYSLDYPGFERPLEKATSCAEKGVQLDPDDQRARTVLALVRMFSNNLSAAREEIERAYVLNPNSLFILDGIGYIMTLVGEWERGTTLIRKVMDLNPYYKPVVHYTLWLDWIRQGEYENAYLETFSFRRPLLFWNPLAKAATCGLLGRNEEGEKATRDLLELKPDFEGRGRDLIERYIKFSDIVERVIRGLNSVGFDELR
jgi:tetratricopeptide (TPR) repeat protein